MKGKTIISKKEVEHIAKLANLPLTTDEVEKFTKELSETLEAIKTIRELKTEKIQPSSQVTGLENVKREDKIDSSRTLTSSEALSNAKKTEKDMFLIPAIFEEQ